MNIIEFLKDAVDFNHKILQHYLPQQEGPRTKIPSYFARCLQFFYVIQSLFSRFFLPLFYVDKLWASKSALTLLLATKDECLSG
jgi:hypothetical protein